MGDILEQPAEIGIGIAYSMENHSFAFEYHQDNWILRLGYNYASNPLSELPSGSQVIPAGSYAMAGGDALNLFNLLGFPATAEEHYIIIGGTYEFSKVFSVNLAYVYAPETTTTISTIVGLNPQTGDIYTGPSTVEHTENSISFQLTYKF